MSGYQSVKQGLGTLVSLKSLIFSLADIKRETWHKAYFKLSLPSRDTSQVSHVRALAPARSLDSPILPPAMLKQHQPMQPGDSIKTERTGNPSSLGATAGFHSPLSKKKERDSLCRHLHGQWTDPVTSHITVREICWHQIHRNESKSLSLLDQSSLTIVLWWMPERFWIFWQKRRLFLGENLPT